VVCPTISSPGDRPSWPERAAWPPAHRFGHRHHDEAEASSATKEFSERSKTFEEELDVDETSRVARGRRLRELEEVAYIDISELATIRGFDEELATELPNRHARRRWNAARKASAKNAARWASRMPWPSCRT
jgi:transcription termination factor NusA